MMLGVWDLGLQGNEESRAPILLRLKVPVLVFEIV